MDYPIKKCDYCGATGKMPTFMTGETTCYICLKRLPTDAAEARRVIVNMEKKLDPRQWTQEMHDAWHKNIPDVQAAFNALRELDT